MPPRLTSEIITAAIDGFEAQKTRIDGQIAELRALLSCAPVEAAATSEASTGKRKKFSAAALQRMREAQKRRWAKVRGESEAPAPADTPKEPRAKRKISAAGKKAIAEAQRKRWAESKKAASLPKTAPAKRKMSAARKAALVANLAKARAARAAKRAATA
jgi:hypothetical protein